MFNATDSLPNKKENGDKKMSINEMTAKVRELKELEALIAEAQEEAEAIKDEIKAQMTAQNTEELSVDVYKVRWTTVKSERLDTTALKKALPDLAKQFTKTSTTRRFSIA